MIKIEEPENLKSYALVIEDKVVNVCLWDGETDWTPEGEVVLIPESSSAGIGWDYIDNEFIDNRPAPINSLA
jgi:hypothetical protein